MDHNVWNGNGHGLKTNGGQQEQCPDSWGMKVW